MRPWYNYDEPPRPRFSFGFGAGGDASRLVIVLVAATAGAFLLELVLMRFMDVFEWLGFYGPNFVRGAVWQPITYMFMHAPYSLLHLLGNLIGLYVFGRTVAEQFGRRAFLLMYFGAGIFGAILQMIFQFDAPVVGASGGVLAVLIAFAMKNPHAQVLLLPLPIMIRAMWIAIFWVFITAVGVLMPVPGRTAHWVHLGGILIGFLFVRYRHLGKSISRYVGARKQLWQAKRTARRARRTAEEQDEMDRILEKVHRDGITSLSNAERDFLNRMSQKLRDR